MCSSANIEESNTMYNSFTVTQVHWLRYNKKCTSADFVLVINSSNLGPICSVSEIWRVTHSKSLLIHTSSSQLTPSCTTITLYSYLLRHSLNKDQCRSYTSVAVEPQMHKNLHQSSLCTAEKTKSDYSGSNQTMTANHNNAPKDA